MKFDSFDIPEIPLEEDIIEQSLESCMDKLESEMYDERIITLQELLLTTDPKSKETSSTACKLILMKYHRILEYVVKDIMKKVEYKDKDDNSEEYVRSLNLNLLANLLSSENNSQTIETLMQGSQWTVTLIDSLVWYVDMAKNYAWNAYLATKCLRMLVPNFDTHEARGGVQRVYSVLSDARSYGNASYDLLEKEANLALSVLEVEIGAHA